MSSPLTEKEQAMLDFITENLRSNGYSPSIRDIRSALNIKSTSTVHNYLDRLEQKGYIQKEGGKSRTLRVDRDRVSGGAALRVPVLGRVTAGQPILAVEENEEFIDFCPSGRYAGAQLFALRVSGRSMIEVGIMDGDTVIVERRGDAEDGNIVVALIGDEATVKTFYREDGYFRLQPENHTMAPILTKELRILGRVIASMRYYH